MNWIKKYINWYHKQVIANHVKEARDAREEGEVLDPQVLHESCIKRYGFEPFPDQIRSTIYWQDIEAEWWERVENTK
jgi:hypothetical protein